MAMKNIFMNLIQLYISTGVEDFLDFIVFSFSQIAFIDRPKIDQDQHCHFCCIIFQYFNFMERKILHCSEIFFLHFQISFNYRVRLSCSSFESSSKSSILSL